MKQEFEKLAQQSTELPTPDNSLAAKIAETVAQEEEKDKDEKGEELAGELADLEEDSAAMEDLIVQEELLRLQLELHLKEKELLLTQYEKVPECLTLVASCPCCSWRDSWRPLSSKFNRQRHKRRTSLCVL